MAPPEPSQSNARRTPIQPPLRCAVIGTGKISEEHLRFLVASPHSDLAAVCDLSPAIARFTSERFAIPGAYSDHKQMLSEVRPDVVHVLTPPRSHRALILDAIDSGAHVITEKPVALSGEELDELLRAASSRGVHLVEDHNYRFNRPVLDLLAMKQRGNFGEIREVEVRMALQIRSPGSRYADANLRHPSHSLPAGVLHEFISHLCYLALCLLPDAESGIDHVACDWANKGGGDLFKYDDLDARLRSGRASARLRFSADSYPDCFEILVRGTHGSARVDLFHPQRATWLAGGSQLAPYGTQLRNGLALVRSSARGLLDKIRQITPYEGLHALLSQTYSALRTGEAPPIGPEDMRRVTGLIDRLLEQADVSRSGSGGQS